MNLEFADECEVLSETYGDIQQDTAEKQNTIILNCKEGDALIWVEKQWNANGWEKMCHKVSTVICISR